MAVLVAGVFAFSLAVRTFYYNNVGQILLSRAGAITSLISKIAADSSLDFDIEVRGLVESFEERHQMELMALDKSGRVLVTSSGFEIDGALWMPDYESAVSAANGTGTYRGDINDEHVMALTVIPPEAGENFSAIRLVVSLEKVDNQIYTMIAVVAVAGLSILIFVMISSFYFIGSIVNPVGEIGVTARKIAQGNFATRLEKMNDDEIGELCDTINYMADELANAEKLKNDFISSVSHELGTPHTAIKGWGETLASGEVDPDTLQKGIRVIMNETDRLSLMVEELLDFSRMQSGRLKMAMSRMDLFAELDEAVLMYTERARREGIALSYQESENPALVMGDKNRLRQVFINIIDNAIKYSDPGGSVSIRCGDENGFYFITVSDQGCGISQQDLPKVKQKFYKANLARRGSGIGLAVADDIVAMHGGRIDIDSAPGSGTTVTILIPVNRRADDLPGSGSEGLN